MEAVSAPDEPDRQPEQRRGEHVHQRETARG